MHLPQRRRLQRNRILFLLAIVLVLSFCQLQFSPSALPASQRVPQPTDPVKVTSRDLPSNKTAVRGNATAPKIRHCIYVDPEPAVPVTTSVGTTPQQENASESSQDEKPPYESKGEYPQDLFSVEERRQGWVVLHIFGIMYVFVALAIVCDEYFVPALGVITEKLQISEDVAGATFMAAGGSAPELFTSLIGVFISHSNVGIGTIVGSAVFNILFVVGTCALFSREILHLTWWPLFRDISFYIVDLLMLILFFLDSVIDWWESLLLLTAYATYVYTMKQNVFLEQWVKQELNKKSNAVQAASAEHMQKTSTGAVADDGTMKPTDVRKLQPGPALQRGSSSASLHNSQMRGTIFQLMIYTLDPLAEEEEKKAPSTVQVTPASDSEPSKDTQKADVPQDGQPPSSSDTSDSSSESQEDSDGDSTEGDENDEPLSLEWPESRKKQAIYLFLFPIVFPLWSTLPDVRNSESKKFFVITFFGSILWIAAFSYLMVWWAHQVGETIGISEEIMGLTILAAGTSIPDLITSVIVARKGLGDMAVSSSVGSNIFDITVGLPVPWFLFSIFNGLSPVAVSSNGLFCAIVLLFLMLLFVIISISLCKWKMNKLLGLTMFALYFVFLIISVMLEDKIISCPVSV
ncbi:sodium/potassium/calcium exchanger 1 isoform X2 [Corvus cornix cornix]|uniref:sodium/potassium/calcium exchanger 1 isoform X2 n=1 Tax=Corvus brachyrhynchos TaxID=85066 RepID=UPI0008163D5B|nr:PREDICTED: sodium/potassium/calcium exchanger 1 isoform X2 [Corvus brachyrhynchos]XP_019136472.1 sodium/potassium/calcium exchanger 1 isoform X2 [Corvus cornix cornix]XP_031978971.1 sodium/potassium/calcium exchanger 1 isoform X2 [Corvus moneduloides]